MRLHVETAGGGDPVLFLHGVANSMRSYSWLRRDGAILLDFRGHGRSERAPGTYRLADFVADTVSVLETLDRPAALVGHSLGGVVAWTVAQQRPELVTRAFLEDPPLYQGEPEAHAVNPFVAVAGETKAAIEQWRAQGMGEDAVKARLAAMPMAPPRTAGEILHDDALAARAFALLRLDTEVLDRVVDGSMLAATDTTSPVRVPVFILASDPAQSVFPPAHEARLAASHPAVEVVRVAGAGHSIHDERAHRDEYVRRLSDFLV